MMRLQYNQLASSASVIILVTCIFLWGCDGDTPTQPEPTKVLSVTPDNRDALSSDGSTTFSVANNGDGTMSWSAIDDASWVTLSGASGTNSGTIAANYGANPEPSPRVCTITVTAPGATGSPKQVTVTQAGSDPILDVQPDNQDVLCSAGSTNIEVTNDGGGTMNWSATEPCYWLSLQNSSGTNNGTITVYYTDNCGGSARTCTITVTAPATGSPKQVTITQMGGTPVLSVSPANWDVSSSAGSVPFEVSNLGGGTMNWSSTEGCNWVTLQNDSGINNGEITANYDANPDQYPRECTIIVTASGATGSPKQVTINQEAYQPCPNVPSNPTPPDGGEDVDTQGLVLSWSGGDPDGGDVTYQVHFGTSNPPLLLDEVINQTTYELNTQLYNDETYYWRIDAIDDDSPSCETPGDVWSFETVATTTITIYSDGYDTFADCDNPEDNWCNSNNIYIGDGSDCYTTYLRFDFSDIPNGAVIPDGGWKIYLWQWQVFGPVSSGDDYALFRNDENWSECSLTYNNRPNRDNTDAHFQDVVDDENLWICLWDPDGLNFTDIVRDMISGARPNYGFQVQCDVDRGTWLTFRSTNNPGRDEDPYLEVTYTWSP